MMASEQSTPCLASSSTHLTAATADKINKNSIGTRSSKRRRIDHSIENTGIISNSSYKSFTSLKPPRYLRSFSREFSPVMLNASSLISEHRLEEVKRNYLPRNGEICRKDVLPLLISSTDIESSTSRNALNATPSNVEGTRVDQNSTTTSDTRKIEDVPETSPLSLKINANLANIASSTIPKSSNSAVKSQSNKPNSEDNGTSERTPDELLSIPPPKLREATLINNFQDNGTERFTSLPRPGRQMTEQSSPQKKHKCPYCDTEFTRHHNLKSHLLTHSQEKPFTCQTCAMRFRRLHDLKRHMKLHTGERPHICPKCDRKFARGDALARHTKGQGGCAGRRSSLSSVGADDDFNESNVIDSNEIAVDGVIYCDSTALHNENEVSKDERRQFNIPNLTIKNPQNTESKKGYASIRTSKSYPQDRSLKSQSTGTIHSPRENQGSSGSRMTPYMKDAPEIIRKQGLRLSNFSSLHASGDIVISQSVITEGLKPPNPADLISFQSDQEAPTDQEKTQNITPPSLSHHLDKKQTNQTSSLGNIPSYSHKTSHGPKLPALMALAPPDQRYALSSQAPTTNSTMITKKTDFVSPNSVVLPGAQNLTSYQIPCQVDLNLQNLFATGEIGVWSYIQTLEDRVKKLTDRIYEMEKTEKKQQENINTLLIEVTSLKSQLKESTIPLDLTKSDLPK